MNQNFYIPISNPKKRVYTIFANILLLICFIFFCFIQANKYHNNIANKWLGFILPCSILIIFIFRFIYILKLRNSIFSNLHFAILASLLWAYNYFWVASIAILILGILEYIINNDFLCTINQKGVHIDSFPAKKYNWSQLQNVMLSQGILTIDTKSNAILQIDVCEETIPFDEKELALFVASQIV